MHVNTHTHTYTYLEFIDELLVSNIGSIKRTIAIVYVCMYVQYGSKVWKRFSKFYSVKRRNDNWVVVAIVCVVSLGLSITDTQSFNLSPTTTHHNKRRTVLHTTTCVLLKHRRQRGLSDS